MFDDKINTLGQVANLNKKVSSKPGMVQADQAMYKAKTSEQHWFIYKPEN